MASAGTNPPITLPPAAEPAWRAYCDMLASKDAHFNALEALSRKHQEGQNPTLAETAHLAKLLATHDGCVATFATQMKALASDDPAAQATLVKAMTRLNQDLGNDQTD